MSITGNRPSTNAAHTVQMERLKGRFVDYEIEKRKGYQNPTLKKEKRKS